MSSSARRASSSSAPNTSQQNAPSQDMQWESAQASQQTPDRPHSSTLGASSVPPSGSSQAAAQAASATTARDADQQQSRPAKIIVKDLNHIREFATEDTEAFSAIGSQSRSRSPRSGHESPQYEISEMHIEHIIEMVAGLLTKITTTNDRQHEHLHQQPPHLQNRAQLNPQTSSVLAFHGKNVPSITILSYLTRINKYCPTSYEVFLSLLVYFDRMTERVNAGPMQSLRQANEAAMEHNQSAKGSSESLESDKMEDVTATTPRGTQQATPPSSGGLERGQEPGRPGTPHSRSTQPDSPPIPSEPSPTDAYNLSHFFVVDSFNIHRLVIAGVTCASKFFSDIFYTNSRYAKVSFGERVIEQWASLTHFSGGRSASPRAQSPRTPIPSPQRLPTLRPRGRDRSLRDDAGRILCARSRGPGESRASRRNASPIAQRQLHGQHLNCPRWRLI